MNDANREVMDRGSLADLLVQRARQASDARLVFDAAVGFSVAVAIVVLHPPLRWPLSALAFALGAFGVWGILDRESRDIRHPNHRLVLAARNIIGALGMAAAVVGAFGVFFGLLGTWIS